MVGVVIINMSTALLVLIVEKTKMIGILKSMGISNKSLRKVFVYHGGILLFLGFAGGNILAFSIMLLQNKYQLLSLPKENYYLDSVPMHFPMTDIIILNSIAYEDDYQGDFASRRAIIYTLSFTAKFYLYGPVTSSKVIKTVQVDQYTDLPDQSPRREQRYSVTPNPTTADADDDFGFSETVSFFQDAKEFNSETGSDE